MSEPLIKSYVWHGNKCFVVSTIDRACSALESYGGVYAETIAWELLGGEKGPQICQYEAASGSISKHQWVVECLHRGGEIKESS